MPPGHSVAVGVRDRRRCCPWGVRMRTALEGPMSISGRDVRASWPCVFYAQSPPGDERFDQRALGSMAGRAFINL